MTDFILAIFQALLGVGLICFFVYVIYLQVIFLKKGIQFFDYASQYILHDAEKENAKINNMSDSN